MFSGVVGVLNTSDAFLVVLTVWGGEEKPLLGGSVVLTEYENTELIANMSRFLLTSHFKLRNS